MNPPLTLHHSSSTCDAILIDINDANTPPELLLSAVLQRISQYTTRNQTSTGSAQAAELIEHHLHMLSDLPSLTPVLRATCQQLSEQWASVAEQTAEYAEKLSKPPRSSFITRLIYGARPSSSSTY